MGRAGGDVPHAWAAGLPGAALLSGHPRQRPGARARARRTPGRGGGGDAALRLHLARAIDPRMGRAARGGPGCPGHLVRGLLGRWRTGPIGPTPRPPRAVTGRRPIFSVWSWNEDRDGQASQPHAIAGQRVVEQLRVRRDESGGLWVLSDGRYAVTG